MQRMRDRSDEEQLAIHVENNLAPVWEVDHRPRIDRVRRYIDAAIASFDRPVTIIDLGVGSGDTSGRYSDTHRVIGIDLTDDSRRVCADRFPRMEHILSPIETAPVEDCDILVACEVLEHLASPVQAYRRFADRSTAVVIGHPLDEPDPSSELFHLWRYGMDDFQAWFADHPIVDYDVFAMGGFPQMIVGWGKR